MSLIALRAEGLAKLECAEPQRKYAKFEFTTSSRREAIAGGANV